MTDVMTGSIAILLYLCLEVCIARGSEVQDSDKRFIANPSPCSDAISNCKVYDPSVCTTYKEWASSNCKASCNMCPGGSGVADASSFHTCKDRLSNCYMFDRSICTAPTYRQYAMDNCAWTCNLCTGMTGGTTPTASPSNGGPGKGCLLGYRVIPQGQSWVEPCKYKCFCLDGVSGRHECKPLCYNWNLPSFCHLDPPTLGKCCPKPHCPSNYTIAYPPGYTEE